jgi:outer membrane protein assembly factor BamB
MQILSGGRRGRGGPRRRGGALRVASLVGMLGFGGGFVVVAAQSDSTGWRQLGGPDRSFIVTKGPRLADAWPETGPATIWSRALGGGHSAILADGDRLFTMYRTGNARARNGPWNTEETVVSLDARTGKTMWEHRYPSRLEDFSRGPGPHSTPLVVGDRLFTFGTNKQLHAFDKRTGKVLWSHDLVKAFGAPTLLIRPVVKAGYGCSPIAYKETIICFVGGPGQAVMAFRQHDGSVAWKSGHFLTSDAPPMLITFEGQPQLVIFAGASINGLNPDTGALLWSHVHDPGNDFNFSPPQWGADNILFFSSGYKAGSRAIRLKKVGTHTETEELWFNGRAQFAFLNTLRLGDFVYGTTGALGPAFLTALNVKTGQPAWQHRGFGQATLIHADGKAILIDEDGDLALLKLAPEGVTVLSQFKLFDTVSWTVPTLVATTLYARDREKIVALDLGVR